MNNISSSTTIMTIDNVYRLFGEASHWASILEEQLCNICMLNECVINQEKYITKSPQSIVAMFEKLPIGKLIEALKKALGKEVENNFEVIFGPALKKRNDLIHRFFIYHHEIIKDGNKIPGAIAELNDIKNSIFQAADVARKICAKITARYQTVPGNVVDRE